MNFYQFIIKIDSDQRIMQQLVKVKFSCFSYGKNVNNKYLYDDAFSQFSFSSSSLSITGVLQYVNLCGRFITIAQPRSPTDCANSLISKFSPLMFSSAWVHGERAPSIVSYQVPLCEVFLAIRSANLFQGIFQNSTINYSELKMRTLWTVVLLCLVVAIVAVYAKPMIYKKNEDNVFEPGERTICYLFACIAKEKLN